MQTLWGDRHRIGLWRRLWLALAEAERELGLADARRGDRRDARAPRRRRPRRGGQVRAAVPPRRDGPRARLRRPGAGRPAVHSSRRHQRLRHRQRRPRGHARGPAPGARPPGRPARRARHLRHVATRRCPASPTPTSSRHSSPRSASARRSGCRTSRSTSRRPAIGSRRCASTAARAPPAPRPRSSSCSTAITRRCASSTAASPRRWASTRPLPCPGRPTRARSTPRCSTC